jgi:hypothetical protein
MTMDRYVAMKKYALYGILSLFVVTMAYADISDTTKTILQNASSDDAALVSATDAASTPQTVVEIAAFSAGIGSDAVPALLAKTLTARFPLQASDIIIALTKTKPALVAEIVLAALTNVDEDKRQDQLNAYILALKEKVPNIEQEPAFAAINVSVSGLGLPTVGLSNLDRRSPN